nr:hypothetical protein [Mycobacterium shigaense]
MVNGRSTELDRPGSAAARYGAAFTTRIAVATMAPAPDVMPPTPAFSGSFSVAAREQSMSGSPLNWTRCEGRPPFCPALSDNSTTLPLYAFD